jgi:uncharacterized protein DUF5994
MVTTALPGSTPTSPTPTIPSAATSGFLGGLRLRLEPTRSRHTMLDGAWWPYSLDLLAELPALVRVLGAQGSPVTHLMLGATASATHPRQMMVDGRRVRLGWFSSQSPALLIAVCHDWERTDLLVVPPDTPPQPADRAMTAAAGASTGLRAADLLATLSAPWREPDIAAHTAWESEGDQVPDTAPDHPASGG